MSEALPISTAFVREHLRAPLTLALLVAIPVFFVLVFASVLGDFAEALGGTLASQSATAISAGWAAAFLSGTLAFFQISSSRGADRRLALAGLGPVRVALSRIVAALAIGLWGCALPCVLRDLALCGPGALRVIATSGRQGWRVACGTQGPVDAATAPQGAVLGPVLWLRIDTAAGPRRACLVDRALAMRLRLSGQRAPNC